MDKTAIKAHAASKGYALSSETADTLVFTNAVVRLNFNDSTNRLKTIIQTKTFYNIVDSGSIDKVAIWLLTKNAV